MAKSHQEYSDEMREQSNLQRREQEMDLEAWDAVDTKEISLEEMDAKIKALQEKWAEVEAIKAKASEARAQYDDQERRVLELLKAAKKSKYSVDGLGTVYISNRYITRVPKGLAEKQALFNWIKEQKGPDTLMGMVSINHQTLNSFLNKEYEEKPGTTVPGVEAPTHEETLGFRAERKK